MLAEEESSNVMTRLKSANPSLLLKEDVRNYGLLHYAIYAESIEMVKYMVQLDPSCLYCNYSGLGIPLSQACLCENKTNRLKMIRHLLHEAVSYNALDATIGGLFAKYNDEKLILNALIEKGGQEDIWSCIKQALASFPDIPILHKVIQHNSQNVHHVITQFPNSVSVQDSQNRLPIHVALECGMEWSSELVLMINLHKDQLKDIDPVTKWPPFVLAALNETRSCDLSTVYFLLHECPVQAEIFLNKMNMGKRKNVNLDMDDSSAKKKRKVAR